MRREVESVLIGMRVKIRLIGEHHIGFHSHQQQEPDQTQGPRLTTRLVLHNLCLLKEKFSVKTVKIVLRLRVGAIKGAMWIQQWHCVNFQSNERCGEWSAHAL